MGELKGEWENGIEYGVFMCVWLILIYNERREN